MYRPEQFYTEYDIGAHRWVLRSVKGKKVFTWGVVPYGIPEGDERPPNQIMRLKGRGFAIEYYHDGTPCQAREIMGD